MQVERVAALEGLDDGLETARGFQRVAYLLARRFVRDVEQRAVERIGGGHGLHLALHVGESAFERLYLRVLRGVGFFEGGQLLALLLLGGREVGHRSGVRHLGPRGVLAAVRLAVGGRFGDATAATAAGVARQCGHLRQEAAHNLHLDGVDAVVQRHVHHRRSQRTRHRRQRAGHVLPLLAVALKHRQRAAPRTLQVHGIGAVHRHTGHIGPVHLFKVQFHNVV